MLTLPIKGRWYQMILDRIKREEYRDDTPYYAARFERYEGKLVPVRLRNGYSKTSPSAICEIIPTRRAGRHNPMWGGEPSKTCWVLSIISIREEQT